MLRRWSRVRTGCLILSVLALMDIVGLLVLYEAGMAARFVPHKSGGEISSPVVYDSPSEDTSVLASDLKAAGIDKLGGREQIVQTLRFVMNSVSVVEMEPTRNPNALYAMAKTKGIGALCSGMSILFQEALAIQDILSRRIKLTRNLLDKFDSHTSVEVLLNDRWALFDPTFNVSFEKDGALLGAFDVQQSLLDGTVHRIRQVFYGEVNYPARLDHYSISWVPLFNNVFIISEQEKFWLKLPPPSPFLRVVLALPSS